MVVRTGWIGPPTAESERHHMDLIILLLIVLAVVVAVLAFVAVRRKQRSGTVLAAHDSISRNGAGS